MINYDPVKAQKDTNNKLHHRKRHYSPTIEKGIIKDALKLTWSPEEIAHRANCCVKSIYNWIYQGVINFSVNLLPDKNIRRKRRHERRGHIHKCHTIEDRPKIVNDRIRFGDWEVDTVLSSRDESKECIATFVEIKTRFVWIIKIPNRTSKPMAWAMWQFF